MQGNETKDQENRVQLLAAAEGDDDIKRARPQETSASVLQFIDNNDIRQEIRDLLTQTDIADDAKLLALAGNRDEEALLKIFREIYEELGKANSRILVSAIVTYRRFHGTVRSPPPPIETNILFHSSSQILQKHLQYLSQVLILLKLHLQKNFLDTIRVPRNPGPGISTNSGHFLNQSPTMIDPPK